MDILNELLQITGNCKWESFVNWCMSPAGFCLVHYCKGFSHLFSDIIVTGVYTVSEQVFCAAITAAEVTVVEELSARSEG